MKNIKKLKKKFENGTFLLSSKPGVGYVPHPQGYCGDQMCCWGKPGDKVQWPNN